MISDPLFWLALLSLGGSIYILLNAVALATWRRRRRMPRPGSLPPPESSLAVILAGRDEEESIERTVRSLVTGQQPAPRVIAVNDRSDDRTGEIIDRLADEHPEVHPVHITTLPEGWLGKCNALEQGAAHLGEEEWILFTDADVEFAPGVLADAVAEADRSGADHFVLFPRLRHEGILEGGILTLFSLLLGTGFRFSRIESDDPEAYIGVGAFNMVRRSLYERFGGHRPLRMEVADDLKMGFLAKKYGGRSTARYGTGEVSVRWRQGGVDTLRGIVRSGFPGLNFSWFRVIWGTGGVLFVFVLPFLLILLTEPGSPQFLLTVATLLSTLTSVALAAVGEKTGLTSILLTPVAGFLFAGATLLSAISITRAGGVWWRETFYPIDELRKGTVR